MADEYEGYDEASLREMLEKADDYEKRQHIRKAIRNIKKAEGRETRKKTGSSQYRRMGGTFQPPKQITIPNSVTGNVLPDKLATENYKKEGSGKAVAISYLNTATTLPPYGYSRVGKEGGASPKSTTKFSVSGAASPRSSPLQSVSSTHSISPESKSPEPQVVPREPSPAPDKEPTPEPEPSPEPPREPTPEPPREPTPEPPREPTPEPPREPTPEPPREPTPEPPREPTPEPPREPTPIERSPTPPLELDEADFEDEQEVKLTRYAEEEDEEEEDVEEEVVTEEEGEEEEEDEHREADKGLFSSSATGAHVTDVISKAEPATHESSFSPLGTESGNFDFRERLRKRDNKINTKAAFPTAKPKAEQVDFRKVLKNKVATEKKMYASGSAVQSDFRSNLKKRMSEEGSEKGDKEREKESHTSEPPVTEEEMAELEEKMEEAEDVKPPAKEETDSVIVSPAPEADSYESRAAARRAKRQKKQQSTERESKSKSPIIKTSSVEQESETRSPNVKTIPNGEAKSVEMNGTVEEEPKHNREVEKTTENTSAADLDSYEARKEARRKAREERLKATAAKMDEKPKLSYKERKAREQLANARDNRKKWESREEDSGEKQKAKPPPAKKKDSATQQLLAWCKHKTKYYENVEVKDFHQSWSDGLAFCAIMHSFLPDKIPFDDLTPDNPRKNFTIAFDAAREEGIPEMLDVEDMVSVRIPDSRSIMTFLVTIYQHFN